MKFMKKKIIIPFKAIIFSYIKKKTRKHISKKKNGGKVLKIFYRPSDVTIISLDDSV